MKYPYLAKPWFLLLFVLLGFPSGAQAQTGSVSGRVLDEKNTGIPGATVLVAGSALRATLTALSASPTFRPARRPLY